MNKLKKQTFLKRNFSQEKHEGFFFFFLKFSLEALSHGGTQSFKFSWATKRRSRISLSKVVFGIFLKEKRKMKMTPPSGGGGDF